MTNCRRRAAGLLLVLTTAAVAQPQVATTVPTVQDGAGPDVELNIPLRMQARTSVSRAINPLPEGRWWTNEKFANSLGLTSDQQKKMDDIFQQNRLKLIDLNATLQKEEAILDPLIAAEQPEDAKVLSQIDRIAQARADLEKANGHMLWTIRRVLTPGQWKKLNSNGGRMTIGPKARMLR
jgi:Spy/CpxP family protein refolding chaperone